MNLLDMERPVPSSLIRHISPPPPKRRKASESSRPNGRPNGKARSMNSPLAGNPGSASRLDTSTHKEPCTDAANTPSISNAAPTTAPNASTNHPPQLEPTLAAVEAGRAKVEDHLAYFTKHLSLASRITPPSIPRLPIPSFASLYASNQHPHGHHFVIHQHNHPQAGVHYDLRLQFSETSSISFAIPKGLPGDPNSRSMGRMAIETRVHNLWNHLIESASWKSGSLLIWDTGTYEVLPRRIATTQPQQTTDEEDTSSAPSESELQPPNTSKSTSSALNSRFSSEFPKHENDKLIHAFQTRYIRLRLHGTRLPRNYTVTLRLPSNNDFENPHRTTHLQKHRRRRRRHVPPHQQQGKKRKPSPRQDTHSTSSDSDGGDDDGVEKSDFARRHQGGADGNALGGEEEDDDDPNIDTSTSSEDLTTRLHNAYPGSTNSIGSVHQRKWFLMLDRRSSGFIASTSARAAADSDEGAGMTGHWRRNGRAGFEPFYVRGRDVERSVVTGRLAREVEADEGVEGYVGRGGWMGIER